MATAVVAIPPSSATVACVAAKSSATTVRSISRGLLMMAVLALVMAAKTSEPAVLRIAAEGVLTSLLGLWSWKTGCLPTLLLSWHVGRRSRPIRLRDRRAWPTSLGCIVFFCSIYTTSLLSTVLLRHWLSLSSESRMRASKRIVHAAEGGANTLLYLGRLSRSRATIHGFTASHRRLSKSASVCRRG